MYMTGTQLSGKGLISCAMIVMLLQVSPLAQADRAGDPEAGADNAEMQNVTDEMLSIAQALLATVAGEPGNVELAVGYNRRELLALDAENEARTNYVYWPYLRKGLPIDFMSAQQRML